ncbi:MAG: hypothetical protein HYU36_02840 [Planctomycetes bacterium]|nr:hypothetical protein [Planctomycetota bacterium]
MIVHHSFDLSPEEFEARKAWPLQRGGLGCDWKGDFASQSPLNAMYISREGDGAEGSSSFLALPGRHSDQFYAEATPYWQRPRQTFDLRNTRATLYLKAITPITVNAGYRPHLFIDDYCEQANTFCGWYLNQPLRVGAEWTLNVLDLFNDEKLWTRYSDQRSLDTVLSRVGFIGGTYIGGTHFRGVDAQGILGIDELRYQIPL